MYRAVHIDQAPLNYFLQPNTERPFLQIADVILRAHKDPADFNNSPNLDWRYVILKGAVWRIEKAPADYQAKSEEEQAALDMLEPEHHEKNAAS